MKLRILKKVFLKKNKLNIKNILIKKINKKIFFFNINNFKKIIFLDNIIKNNFFYLKTNYFFYIYKIIIFFFKKKKEFLKLIFFNKKNLYNLIKKFNFLKKNIFNCIIKFKKKIKINKNYKLLYFFFLKKNILKNILNNNYNIINKIIKKYKSSLLYSDIYQESILEFNNCILFFNYYKKKNFFRFCYWKIKKKINNILNKKNQMEVLINNNIEYENYLIKYDNFILKCLIRIIISEFTVKEQKIIRLRFGIGMPRIYTLEEISEIFYFTKERIRQIEFKLIIRIKNSVRSQALKSYLKIRN